MQNSSPFSGVSVLAVGFLPLPPDSQEGVFTRPIKGTLGHSVDGCGKKSYSISWLRMFGKAVIQILLNYFIGFRRVSKQIIM